MSILLGHVVTMEKAKAIQLQVFAIHFLIIIRPKFFSENLRLRRKILVNSTYVLYMTFTFTPNIHVNSLRRDKFLVSDEKLTKVEQNS